MTKARKLVGGETKSKAVTFGVMATGDPRIDQASRDRSANIVGILADHVAQKVRMPDGHAGRRGLDFRFWSTVRSKPTSWPASSARLGSTP